MQPWWLDAVCEDWDVAIAENGDNISGIWAYPIEQKMGITMMRTPLLTPYLGPHIYYPPDIKESKLDSFEYDTMADLMKQLPPAKVWHLAIQPGIKQVGLFKQYKLRPQVQQTFLLELNGDEGSLLSNMKDTMRRNLRLAEKEIIVTESNGCLKDLYDFQQKTLSRKDKQAAYSFSDLERILKACIANNAGTLLVAKEGEQTQAIIWQVWDNNCSYYFMGG